MAKVTKKTAENEEATSKDILLIGKEKYQISVHGFYLDGKKYLASEITKDPSEFALILTKVLAIEGQNILKAV